MRLGDWDLDLDSHRLVRGGEEHSLKPKELGVLRHLVERSPALVTTDELLARTWPDVVVGDHVLHEVVSRLRKMLGDNPRQATYIETLPRRGYRWIADVASPTLEAEARAPERRVPTRRWTVPAAALVAVVAGCLWWILGSRQAEPDPVVMVVPFEVIAAVPPDADLAGGWASEVCYRLGKVPGLVVISGTAVSRALDSGMNPLDAAAELGATHIVEGSLMFGAAQVRVTTRLVDARTQRQVWSLSGNTAIDDALDALALQSEVAIAVADALGALTPETRRLVESPPTRNAAAYALFQQASPQRLAGGDPAQNRIAINLLADAVRLDPGFSDAVAWQAWREVWAVWTGDADRVAPAKSLAERALKMAPESGMANYAMGRVHTLEGNYRLALQRFHRASELDRSNPVLLGDLSLFEGLIGNLEGSLDMALRGLRVAPDDPQAWWATAIALRRLGELPRARRLLEVGSGDPQGELSGKQRVDLALTWLRMADGERMSIADYRALPAEVVRYPQARSVVASQLLLAGHWQQVVEWLGSPANDNPRLRSGLEDNPMARSVRTQLGFARLMLGEHEEAHRLLQASLADMNAWVERGTGRPSVPLEIAAIHAAQGNNDLAMEWLTKACEAGFLEYTFLEIDPMFRTIREDPRFDAVQRRMAQEVAGKLGNAAQLGLIERVDELLNPVRKKERDRPG